MYLLTGTNCARATENQAMYQAMRDPDCSRGTPYAPISASQPLAFPVSVSPMRHPLLPPSSRQSGTEDVIVTTQTSVQRVPASVRWIPPPLPLLALTHCQNHTCIPAVFTCQTFYTPRLQRSLLFQPMCSWKEVARHDPTLDS